MNLEPNQPQMLTHDLNNFNAASKLPIVSRDTTFGDLEVQVFGK